MIKKQNGKRYLARAIRLELLSGVIPNVIWRDMTCFPCQHGMEHYSNRGQKMQNKSRPAFLYLFKKLFLKVIWPDMTRFPCQHGKEHYSNLDHRKPKTKKGRNALFIFTFFSNFLTASIFICWDIFLIMKAPCQRVCLSGYIYNIYNTDVQINTHKVILF